MEGQLKRQQPDGGHGWVILASCTLLHFIGTIQYATFGLFFIEFVEHFNVSKTQVILIMTTSIAASGIFGIFSGTLTAQLGCKRLLLIFAFISAVGGVISAFVPNVYILYMTKGFVDEAGHVTPYTFLPSLAKRRGVPSSERAWLVSIIGICSCMVRPLYGIVADKGRRYRVQLFALSAVITGAILVLTSQLESFTTFAVTSALLGLFNGNYIVLMPTILSDVVSGPKIATAGGVERTCSAIISIARSYLAGYMVDVTNSFKTPFIAFGILQISSIFPLVAMKVILLMRNKKLQRQADTELEVNSIIKT